MGIPILPDRWEELVPLIDAALDREGDDRRAFIDDACRADPALRSMLEHLVAECERPAPLLDGGAIERLSPLAQGAAMIPDVIAQRYRVERRVGEGGMATVYLARDLRHERNVAVKVLRPELRALLGTDRFLAEIKVTAALQHPNVLALYDSGEFEGALYYVMPFVDGESLRERLVRGELAVDEALAILRDVCMALAYAHERGIVHRDIKPDNILLSAHGAFVADFGIAKALDASTIGAREADTAIGIAVGTPAYMAPEQAAGNETVDHRADIYALGAVAYEMLTSRRPFEGESARELSAARVGLPPTEPRRLRPAVPASLSSMVMACLAVRPDDRPQSATSMLRAIEQPTSAAWRSRGGRVTTRVRAAVTIAAVVALSFAGVVALQRRADTNLNPRRIVVAPFANMTGDTSLNVLGPMIAQAVTTALEPLDSIEVVPTLAILPTPPNVTIRRLANIADLRSLSAEARAGRVVWGSYTRHGDTLRIHGDILSAGGRIELSIDPVVASASSPMAAVDRVRDAVTAAVLVLGARRSIGSLPGHVPTLAAFREFMAGWDVPPPNGASGVVARNMSHNARAIQLDSSFVLPYWYLGMALWNRRRFDALDSLVRLLEARRREFSPVEDELFADLEATSRQDWERELIPLRAMLRRDSTFQHAYLVAFAARQTNRPREGLDVLSHYPVSSGVWDRYASYWQEAPYLHHMLGNYDDELALATAGASRVLPASDAANQVFLNRTAALAALGRLAPLRAIVDSAVGTWSPASSGLPSVWYYQIACELRAHGQPRAAEAYVARGLAWHAAHPDTSRDVRDAANLLVMAGQFDSARIVWQTVRDNKGAGRRVQTDRARGALGIIGARTGDTALALAMLRALDSSAALPHAFGEPQVFAAGIASWLARKDDAMRLLTQGHKAGRQFHPFWHRMPELEPLWDYPPFIEFLRPKG